VSLGRKPVELFGKLFTGRFKIKGYKMKKIVLFCSIFCITTTLWIAGCSGISTKYFPAHGAKTYPSTKDLLIFRDYPERQYEILGVVSVSAYSGSVSKKRLFSRLKKKAMAVGAHAIVVRPARELTREISSSRRTEFVTSRTVLEAVAIRFKEPEQNPEERK